jgi:hypothetical protein
LERTWLGENQFIGYYGMENYWVFIWVFAWDYWGGFWGVGGHVAYIVVGKILLRNRV